MSQELVDHFQKLSFSCFASVPLNKNKFNVGFEVKEFDLFYKSKKSFRILLNFKDMSLLNLKAGSLIGLRMDGRTLDSIFEAWPSISTRPSVISFGIINTFEWLGIDSSSKLDILALNISQNPVLESKFIEIQFEKMEKSLLEEVTDFLASKPIFMSSSRTFLLAENKPIFFNIREKNSESNGIFKYILGKSKIEIIRPSGTNPNQTMVSSKFGGSKDLYEEIFRISSSFFNNESFLLYDYIRSPRGILLYGPPGTGKTLLVQCIASRFNVPVISLTASDLSSGSFGEAETKIMEKFKLARNLSPSIIFMDELDSLSPKRADNTNSYSQRITTFLLTLMDGCTKESSLNSRIFFFGATNSINSVDSAMRRTGRFDFEVEIPPPSKEDRIDIIQKIIEKISNSLTNTEVERIAEIAHGFVGADLNSLCKEAYLHAVHDISINYYEHFDSVIVSFNHFLSALTKVKPSAMREFYIDVPNTKWADIGGQHLTKQKLIECVDWPIKFPHQFQKLGIKPPRGILLFGPPGCSKTLLAKALASESGLNFLAVKGPEIFSKYVGESEKRLREIFKKARQASPSIIFFDEFDSIASKNEVNETSSSVSNRVMSQLLNEMDGLEPLLNVIIIAATNKPDLIDKALLRPGRFDRHIFISPPDFEGRLEIVRILMKKTPCDKSIFPENIADLTDGFSGAEINSLFQNAAIKALERNILSSQIEFDDIKACLHVFNRQIDKKALLVFEKFIQ